MLEQLGLADPRIELPLATLQEVTKHVATFSRKSAPKLVQQKRQFVRGWYEDQVKLSGYGGRGGGGGGGGGGGRGPSPPRRPGGEVTMIDPGSLDPDQVFAEVDARVTAARKSITHPELAEMHVDMLAEQICALMGEPMPIMARDRRNLVMRWHSQQENMRRRRRS